MSSAQDFVLQHAQMPYDPAKRREYYLKNRQLKGRRKGSSSPAPSPTNGGRPQATEAPKAPPATKPPTKADRDLRAQAEARVTELKARLEKLNAILKELLAEARKADQAEKRESSSSTTSTSSTSKPTAKEKRETSKRWDAYKRKHPDTADKPKSSSSSGGSSSSSDSMSKSSALENNITRVKANIVDVRAKLETAIDAARKSTTH